jgi:phosphatidylglycerophosphate synthase
MRALYDGHSMIPWSPQRLMDAMSEVIVSPDWWLGITSNEITCSNMCLRIVILLILIRSSFLAQRRSWIMCLYALLFLSSWLDALDGFVARRYHLCSELGEKLDHTSDGVFALMLFCIVVTPPMHRMIFLKSKSTLNPLLIILLTICRGTFAYCGTLDITNRKQDWADFTVSEKIGRFNAEANIIPAWLMLLIYDKVCLERGSDKEAMPLICKDKEPSVCCKV